MYFLRKNWAILIKNASGHNLLYTATHLPFAETARAVCGAVYGIAVSIPAQD